MKIVVVDSFDKTLPEKLKPFGEVITDLNRINEATVLLVRSRTTDKALIDKAPNLKLIIRGGVGTDNIDKEHCKTKNIIVKNTPKASSISVAELAFAMMIAVPNHIVAAHNSMKEGKWLKKELERTELYGKTLAMIGLGNIGTEIAKRAQAFGMKVVAFDIMAKHSDYAEIKGSVEEAITGADYISLNTPLTDATRNMVNAALIDKMKNGVIFVNTARAKCVNEQDMLAALNSGKVSCYATDVWPNDPPASDYILLNHPKVLMAPHLGASTKENLGRVSNEVVEIIATLKKEGKI